MHTEMEAYTLVQNDKSPFLNEINGAYHFIVSRIGYIIYRSKHRLIYQTFRIRDSNFLYSIIMIILVGLSASSPFAKKHI